MPENGKHWTESFKMLTPILVTIALFLLSSLRADVKDINDKLFKHLTNDDLHAPKSMIVSQEAFTLYQVMRDAQMSELKSGITEIKEILKTKK